MAMNAVMQNAVMYSSSFFWGWGKTRGRKFEAEARTRKKSRGRGEAAILHKIWRPCIITYIHNI